MEYAKDILDAKSNPNSIDLSGQSSHDLNLNNNRSFSGGQCGRSLAWLGHRPPTPTTRVQIPATALMRLLLAPINRLAYIWKDETLDLTGNDEDW